MPRVAVNQLSNSETVSHTEHNVITPITFSVTLVGYFTHKVHVFNSVT